MPPTTNTERRQLLGEFKAFAFEFSPMFRRDAVQAVEERRRFILSDERETPLQLRGSVKPDITIVELGFSAMRKYGNGGPGYTFSFGYELSRAVTFDELPDSIAESAVHAYCRMETGMDIDDVVADLSDKDEESDGDTIDMQLTGDVVEDLIADLRDPDMDTEIMAYKGIQHTFDSALAAKSKFEAGYTINGQIFYCGTNTDVQHDTHLTRRLAPERELFALDGAEIDKEYETMVKFEEILKDAGLEERNVASFETFEETMRQVRFIMRAFRTGELEPEYMNRSR